MVQEIAPNVLVETGFHGANVGCIITGEGVILIDAPMLPVPLFLISNPKKTLPIR